MHHHSDGLPLYNYCVIVVVVLIREGLPFLYNYLTISFPLFSNRQMMGRLVAYAV